jgi:phosphatidylglycerophosphate synthase
MLEAKLRSNIQPLFEYISYALPGTVTPNGLTICALATGLIAGSCIALGYLVYAFIALWISGLCDVLDGTRARQTGMQNPLGAYIDLISDRTVESAIIVGFAYIYPQHMFLYLLFVISVLLHFSTFLAAGALFPNTGTKSIYYDHSLIERFEAFIGFSLMLIIPSSISQILSILNLLIFYSAVMRFKRVLQEVQTRNL